MVKFSAALGILWQYHGKRVFKKISGSCTVITQVFLILRIRCRIKYHTESRQYILIRIIQKTGLQILF